MSAGAFLRSKYELSSPSGVRVPIRVQPETLTLTIGSDTNAPPDGALTAGWPSAQVSGGRRGLGIFARTATFVFTGTPPAGYKVGATLTLPILTPEFALAIDVGVNGSYTVAGTAHPIQFISKVRSEKVR